MAMHSSGSPILFSANVHCAAATQNFLALEMTTQAVDNPWWENLVKTTDGRKLVEKGYANVPLTAPGLGIELNEDEVKSTFILLIKAFLLLLLSGMISVQLIIFVAAGSP